MIELDRDRPGEIAARLAQLARLFRQNVLAATGDWSRHVKDEALLDGMTARGKRRARYRAQAQGLEGFLLTLDARSVEAVVDHAADRMLRREVYEAYVTRASDHGPRKLRFDNSALLRESLDLRHELAVLLGYDNYAELALRDRVLTRAREVERFLLTGGEQTRARAQAELDEIWAFAKAKGAAKGFSTWDLGYYASWRAREQLGFCEDDLRPYFALPDVLSGLFALCEQFLGVCVEPLAISGDAPRGLIHCRLQSAAAREIGRLEIDPCRPAHHLEGVRIAVSNVNRTPTLRITCDLDPLDQDGHLLLGHSELAALFRCMGRGLFSLLAGAGRPDAIASEIAGSYFERFCFHHETLAWFAKHCATRTSLPQPLFDAFLRGRELQRGLREAQELELALFDLRLHRDYVPPDRATQLRAHVFDTLSQVRREVCVLRPPFWEQPAHTSSALFVEDRAVRSWEAAWAQRRAAELFDTLEASGFAHEAVERLRESFWYAGERGVLERLEAALEASGATA